MLSPADAVVHVVLFLLSAPAAEAGEKPGPKTDIFAMAERWLPEAGDPKIRASCRDGAVTDVPEEQA